MDYTESKCTAPLSALDFEPSKHNATSPPKSEDIKYIAKLIEDVPVPVKYTPYKIADQ